MEYIYIYIYGTFALGSQNVLELLFLGMKTMCNFGPVSENVMELLLSIRNTRPPVTDRDSQRR